MRKMIWIAIPLVLLAFTFFAPKLHAQPMGPGMMGGGPGYGPYESGEGWSYCPYCGGPLGPGGYSRGPGMMQRGWGMGPGMMGPGYGRGYGYGYGPGMHHRGMGPGMMGPGYGYGSPYRQPQEPLTKEGAKAQVEDYLKSSRNPNLKVGGIEDKGPVFEVEIVTKDGSLVDKLAVNKETGWMHSIY